MQDEEALDEDGSQDDVAEEDRASSHYVHVAMWYAY